ncbi:MAG: YbaK/EbsC family protein [Caldilineaceae bacterium]|nr:YbaK/EbsC family protein [Caldilineaceae bacterium]
MAKTTNEATAPVALALEVKRIPFRLYRHPGPVDSLEQAASERGQTPEQVVRSILFRLGKDRYAMVLVAGPEQIAWKALRKTVGQSRISMASQSEVLTVTGYEIGAVSPFGLPSPLPIYVDESVTGQEEVSIGSGLRGTTIILRSADLMRGLEDATVGDFRSE